MQRGNLELYEDRDMAVNKKAQTPTHVLAAIQLYLLLLLVRVMR